jgi:hypothetical protein
MWHYFTSMLCADCQHSAYAKCRYAKCRLAVVMLSEFMLNDIIFKGISCLVHTMVNIFIMLSNISAL